MIGSATSTTFSNILGKLDIITMLKKMHPHSLSWLVASEQALLLQHLRYYTSVQAKRLSILNISEVEPGIHG